MGIFDWLTGSGAKPAWSYLEGNAPGGVGKGFGAMPAMGPGPTGIAKVIPTLGKGARVVGRALPGVGTALAIGAEGMNVTNAVNDPNATGIDVATRVAEGAGRLGAMGAGAGLGAMVGGPVGGVLGGATGYFAPNAIYAARDWMRGGAAPVTAPVAAPAAVPITGPSEGTGLYADQQGFGAMGARSAPAPAATLPPVAPMTAADIRGTVRPPSGTGGFVNNSTGAVTNLDTRKLVSAGGYGATPTKMPNVFSPDPRVGGPQRQEDVLNLARTVGGAAGSSLRLASAVGERKTGTAYDKMALDYVGKGAVAAHSAAQADREALQTAMAREHLVANPGDYAGAAGIAAGRPLPTDKFGALPSMSGNDLITYDKSGKGVPKIQTPVRPVSAANIDAVLAGSMKGKTRAQVIQAYKDKGYDVSGVK